MKSRFALLVGCFVLLASLPVFAGTITYSFGGGGGAKAASLTFGTAPTTITAYGYVGSSSHDLYLKDTSTTEDGLGLKGQTDDEINPNQAVVFDLYNLAAQGYTSGTFELGSLQYHSSSDDEAAVACTGGSLSSSMSSYTCGSPTVGDSAAVVQTSTVTWSEADPYVAFFTAPGQTDRSGNFLVDSLTAQQTTTTPEPATIFLLLPGLLLFGLIYRRRTGAASLVV
ncbi:MAG: PEP-CTERM sorting domain-containing protein [Terriglobales bacterium]